MAWVILAARLTMDGLDGSPVEESGAEAHHGVSPHRAAADYYIPGCDTAAAALERWQRAEREGFALLQQQQQEEEKEMEGEEEQQQQQEDDAVELQSSQPGGGGSDTGLSRLLGTLTKLQWLLRRQSGHQLTEEVEDKLVQALVAADAVVNTVTWPEWMQHHRSLVDKYTGVRSFTDT